MPKSNLCIDALFITDLKPNAPEEVKDEIGSEYFSSLDPFITSQHGIQRSRVLTADLNF